MSADAARMSACATLAIENEWKERVRKDMGKGILIAILALAPAAIAESLSGVWDATINFSGVEIPFKIEFAGDSSDCPRLVLQWRRTGRRRLAGHSNMEH